MKKTLYPLIKYHKFGCNIKKMKISKRYLNLIDLDYDFLYCSNPK